MGNITFNFKGYHVVITGAASGIGFTSAEEFAKAGADIALIDFNAEGVKAAAEKIAALGVNARPYVADVSKADQVDAACALIIEDFGGKVDVVFCNAGAGQKLETRGSAEKPGDEEWERLYQINTMGDIRVTRAFIPLMKQQKFGKILINSADAAYRPDPVKACYCVTKIASLDYGLILAKELGPYNINVNILSPGFVYTAIYSTGTALAMKNFYSGLEDCKTGEDVLNTLSKQCLIPRPQTTQDIAYSAMFLCSEEAKQITGQVIHPDAGLVYGL